MRVAAFWEPTALGAHREHSQTRDNAARPDLLMSPAAQVGKQAVAEVPRARPRRQKLAERGWCGVAR